MNELENIIDKHYQIVIKSCIEDKRKYKISIEEHKEWFTNCFLKWDEKEAIDKVKQIIKNVENRHEPKWFCVD